MAEYLLKEKFKKMGLESNFEVSSAGTSAFFPQPATKNARLVMNEIGIEMSKHVSRLLNPKMIETSDIILTMEEAHKQSIVDIFPSSLDKTFTLKEFVLDFQDSRKDLDIIDPYGKDIEEYRKCRDELNYLLDKLLIRIDDLW